MRLILLFLLLIILLFTCCSVNHTLQFKCSLKTAITLFCMTDEGNGADVIGTV